MSKLLTKTQVLNNMLLREPYQRFKRMHPMTIKRLLKTTQTPEPLSFKLHQVDVSLELPHQPPLGLK